MNEVLEILKKVTNYLDSANRILKDEGICDEEEIEDANQVIAQAEKIILDLERLDG